MTITLTVSGTKVTFLAGASSSPVILSRSAAEAKNP
jgi:hypothetical protein